MTGDPAVTLAFAALVVLFVAAVALAGFLYLLLTEHSPEPEPPEWVNDAAPRPCRRPARRGNWRQDCPR